MHEVRRRRASDPCLSAQACLTISSGVGLGLGCRLWVSGSGLGSRPGLRRKTAAGPPPRGRSRDRANRGQLASRDRPRRPVTTSVVVPVALADHAIRCARRSAAARGTRATLQERSHCPGCDCRVGARCRRHSVSREHSQVPAVRRSVPSDRALAGTVETKVHRLSPFPVTSRQRQAITLEQIGAFTIHHPKPSAQART